MKKIYFAGSIRGGRDDRALYEQIIAHLQNYGDVLTEHIGDKSLSEKGEKGLTDKEIFDRDIAWLTASEVIVAEVTTPSHGVGFEIATGMKLNKKILCLYRPSEGKRLSAMIAGCEEVDVKLYSHPDEAFKIIDEYFRENKNR